MNVVVEETTIVNDLELVGRIAKMCRAVADAGQEIDKAYNCISHNIRIKKNDTLTTGRGGSHIWVAINNARVILITE